MSIDELETQVVPAPNEGSLFTAHATLQVPLTVELDDLRDALEAVTPDLMVELDAALIDEPDRIGFGDDAAVAGERYVLDVHPRRSFAVGWRGWLGMLVPGARATLD